MPGGCQNHVDTASPRRIMLASTEVNFEAGMQKHLNLDPMVSNRGRIDRNKTHFGSRRRSMADPCEEDLVSSTSFDV